MTTHLDDDYTVRSGGSLTIASGASLVLEDGSTLDTSGGYETFAANGNMPATSTLALVDTASGTVTVTLPLLASVQSGHTFVFVKPAAANSMVIDGNGAEQIEGAANVTRTAQNAVVRVRKAGSVWVLEGDLKASNNLAELASAATARTNLGIQDLLHHPNLDLVGATGTVWRYTHPTGAPSATITRITSVISGALTTGDATITAAIAGVAVTDGVITITQGGSAAGDVDEATPSAANVIAAGQTLTLTVAGTNDATRTAGVTVRLTY